MFSTDTPLRLRPARLALVALALSSIAAAAHAAGPEDAEAGPARYADALDSQGRDPGFLRPVGAAVIVFDSAETDALVAAGWEPSAHAAAGEFVDLGDRVTTFVAIAEALGHDPAVGALQANWGTPQENGIDALADAINATAYAHSVAGYDIAELERHRADAAAVLAGMQAAHQAGTAEAAADVIAALEAEIVSVDRRLAEIRGRERALAQELAVLESELATAMGAGQPATEPAGWTTANLDVTGDGSVDRADLEAVRNGQVPADGVAVAR